MVWGRGPTSFFCMWIAKCPSGVCWKDCSFSIEWSWHSCWKLIYLYSILWIYGFISRVLTLFRGSVYPMPWTHHFDHCIFVVIFGIGKCECSNFVLSSSLFWLFKIPLNFIWILGWVFPFLLQKRPLGFW